MRKTAIFETDDRVALNDKGIRVYSRTRTETIWVMRRGYVERGNPQGGGEVLVKWNDVDRPHYVPAMYLRLHEIGNVPSVSMTDESFESDEGMINSDQYRKGGE